jgi:Xaa-Pro dipeptidase
MSKQPGIVDPAPREEIRLRVAGLKKGLVAAGIDFAIVTETVDLYYLTGSMQKAILVVAADQEPLYFVRRSLDRAREESPWPVIPIKSDMEISELTGSSHAFCGKGGMELDVVPVALYEKMKSIAGTESFADISGILRALRIVKSPYEIEQLKNSGAICDYIFRKAAVVIAEGAREVDIDAELLAEGRRRGHQGFLRMRGFNQEMMNLFVAAGYTGAIPSAGDVPVAGLGLGAAMPMGSSTKKVERHVPVIVDCGGGYNGYITDETRSFVVGTLDEMFRRPFEVSRAIVEDTQSFGKEGVDCTEIFDRAFQRVEAARLGSYFMGFGEGQVSFMGHGVGLEINELPVITARYHTVLREGMVFAFEPKFVFPGKGVIGIEVDFIVRKDRLERVTKTPIDLVQI